MLAMSKKKKYNFLSFFSLALTKGQIKGTAAVFDDRVVFGSWDCYIYCLNATDGRLLWTFVSDGIIMSSPAIDPRERQVFIGSNSGVLIALSLDTGQLIWSLKTDGKLKSSPVLIPLDNDKLCPKQLAIIIGDTDEILYGVCATNGRILFKQSLNIGSITNEIAIDFENAIYISTNSGRLIKLK
jgi:glucose dehydrogenase